MDLGLKDRNAIITGGSDGIGLAIAEALAREGCNVAIGARGQEKLEKAVARLEMLGVKAVGISTDFSASEGCDRFVTRAVAALGGIDILVNNVGGMTPGTIETLSDEDWAATINVNLMSYIWTTRAALPYVRKSTMGRILNVSGLTGTQLLPGTWSTTIGNAGIHGVTKQLAALCAPDNITVNAICPGTTATDAWMGPRAEAMGKSRGMSGEEVRKEVGGFAMLNRLAQPEEIGDVAAFLVSDKNSYMTGTTVEVCGGWAKYIG